MAFISIVIKKIRIYRPLIKTLQTGLLLATAVAGFMSTRSPVPDIGKLTGLCTSMFLVISGSTVLNMWWDRDIDAKMGRTKKRPTSSGLVTAKEVLYLGLILSIPGVVLAVLLDLLYGLVVFSGLFFDVVVYSIWLKRRSCWGILWGGVAGAMPVFAGRLLSTGHLDWVGIAMALGILFWIPTHTITFSMKYFDDYQAAGVPTFPSTYGLNFTRAVIAISSVLSALAIGSASWGIGMTWGFLRLLAVLTAGLLLLAFSITFRPSERINFGLFKYASIFMLGAMIMIILDVL
jgi:heme o synthase